MSLFDWFWLGWQSSRFARFKAESFRSGREKRLMTCYEYCWKNGLSVVITSLEVFYKFISIIIMKPLTKYELPLDSPAWVKQCYIQRIYDFVWNNIIKQMFALLQVHNMKYLNHFTNTSPSFTLHSFYAIWNFQTEKQRRIRATIQLRPKITLWSWKKREFKTPLQCHNGDLAYKARELGILMLFL